MKSRKGFTLVELMVVIMIVGILAAVSVPLMRGKINEAKWSEANATCGTINTAMRAYYAQNGLSAANALTGLMNVAATQTALGFTANDLTGTYFGPANYTISAVTADGVCTIAVTAGTGLSGTKTYNGATGSWQ